MRMNVLSLFDGISCGQLALKRAKIKYDKYFASETDKYAMSVTQKNFPKTIQLGDIISWRDWRLPKIDLIMGGSPCQGFSLAGKQLNFEDPRSKLFFEFVDILKYVKPKYFLLENVKMKKESQVIITEYLGVKPIEINSALVSAQNRKRLYWTNISNVKQPKDRKIMLESVIESGEVDVTNYKGIWNGLLYFKKCRRQIVFKDKAQTILSTVWKENAKSMVKRKKHGLLVGYEGHVRKLTPLECERLQTVPDDYTRKGLEILSQAFLVGNGFKEKEKNRCLQYVNSKNVINQFQIKKLNYAISTIIDSLGMEEQNSIENLSIKIKNVPLKNVKITNKQLKATVLSIINHGKENNQLIERKNVRFVINRREPGVWECALSIIHNLKETEMLCILKKENTNLTGTLEENTIKQKMVDGFIMLSLKKISEENSKKGKLYIMLILINLIIVKSIYMSVRITELTWLCIDSWSQLQENLLKTELSYLNMGNIIEISNSNRYKMIGNGWTVDVIAHILKNIKKK